MDLPTGTGTVTFLFTDIEGSSRLWERHPVIMRKAVARHDELLKTAVGANQGHVVKMRGDGLHAVFVSVHHALAAAVAGQRALQAEAWDPDIARLAVRMGLHSGSAQLRDGDYFGPTVNRAARLQDAGHGGQILLSQVSAGLVGSHLPAGISLHDLGRHQIKDFPAPERIYQVNATELPGRFPPLRATGGRRTNLSAQATSFVGREREMKTAIQMLERERLVTLTGPGGTGKTRLALQVAAELSGNYGDGVWLIELAPLADDAMILPAIAKVFALQTEPGRPLETVLVDFLRSKTLLLLLDNCEHLIDACARLVGEFLHSAAGLTVLASSREAMGVPGEMILRVPSLTLPANVTATADILMGSEAAQLLAERGRAVRRDFQITDENAAAVSEICRRLDGIPLAIELAASRLRLFSPQQLAARLNDRFRLLTGGSRTALPRQQTLQALIDWSYELLSDEEQELFRRLSVFVGGWTFEAAEAVCGELDVLELLDQLVNKSLVQSEQEGHGFRFRYLETLRQYARDRLYNAGDGEEVRDLHFAYFAGLAATAEKDFGGLLNEELRPLLNPEIDNFRQAMGWGMESDLIAAVDLLAGYSTFLAQDSDWLAYSALVDEVSDWLATAAQAVALLDSSAVDELQRKRAVARIHAMFAQITVRTGDYGRMHSESEKAIGLAREAGDQFTLMGALGFFALASSTQGAQEQEAIGAAEECLMLARKLKKPYYKFLALSALAEIEMRRGNIANGEAYLAEVTKGAGFVSALALYQGGRLMAYYADDPAKALQYLKESRRLFSALENEHFIAACNSQIAHIQRLAGDIDAAEAAYRETLAHFHWEGNRSAVAHELECLAFIAQARHEPERAACMFGAAEALRELGETTMLTHEREEYDQALALFEQELDPGLLQEAWTAGRAMDVDRAVDYALAGPTAKEN